MNCPLCRENSERVFQTHDFWLRDCLACRHRFTEISADEMHVSQIYDNSYFNGGGAGYTDYLQEAEMLRNRGRMYAKKLENINRRKGTLLDVGAAAGFILQGFIDEGWQGTGLEPNAAIAIAGREKFGLNIHQGSLENFETNETFDLISMIQVAAHFYDPAKAFQKAFDLLNENGFLLIETWDLNSISARLFGKNWHEYSPPSVLQFFSQDGLTAFLKRLGFEKNGGGRPSKKISGAHAKSLLKHKIGDNFLLKLIPDKLNFPYPSEDLFWALYQKKGRS